MRRGTAAASVPPIQVGTNASFTLRDAYLYNNAFFGETARLDAVVTAGRGSRVRSIDRSVIYDTRRDMAAVLSVGGDVKIVSSVFDNGGGVFAHERRRPRRSPTRRSPRLAARRG